MEAEAEAEAVEAALKSTASTSLLIRVDHMSCMAVVIIFFKTQEGVEQMVSRLMRDSEEHTPDTNRTMSNSPYKDVISIFTSYQMGGWDYWH